MKYLYWFKGLILIALACSVNAQGSTFVSSDSENNTIDQGKTSPVYNLAVSAGTIKNREASANLTISGENSKVSVEKAGTVSLVAGKSIVLHPGTKISKGSFLYASIERTSKNGKNLKKETRLVTVEEKMKIEEQASLAFAATLLSPFPSNRKGNLHAGDTENGSYSTAYNELSGISPEQQRKVAVESHPLPQISTKPILTSSQLVPAAYGYRPQIMMVLRL